MGTVAGEDAAGQEFRAAAEEFQAARDACTAAYEQVRDGDQRSLQRYVRARERLDAALQRLSSYAYEGTPATDEPPADRE